MADSAPQWLLGRWISDPEDQAALRQYGSASLDFNPNGSLLYSVFTGGRCQQFSLQYRVEGDILFTDQLSQPGEERTSFGLLPNGKLRLTFGGHTSTYVRGD